MANIQSCQAKFEKASHDMNLHQKKVLIQDYFASLKEYIDFSFAHNGYRDVLEYFKKKEGPREAMAKSSSHAKNLADGSERKAVEINISGISMKNEQKNLDNDKSNLNSKLNLN